MPRLRAIRELMLPQDGSLSQGTVQPGQEFDCPEKFVERFLRIGAAETLPPPRPAARKKTPSA